MKFHITENQQVICEPSPKQKSLIQITLTQNMNLFYVIQRFKRGRSKNQQSSLGDNCPFLYGLKQLDGLSVTQQYQDIFYRFATEKVQQHFHENFPFDYIVLLPSSHDITQNWAEQLGYDIPILNNILRKKFNYEIKQEIDQLYQTKQIDKKIYTIITQKCIMDNDVFALKHIPIPYRPWIKPLALNPLTDHDLNGKRLLLMDDICSSGTSLLIANEILRQTYDIDRLDALTLFGKI